MFNQALDRPKTKPAGQLSAVERIKAENERNKKEKQAEVCCKRFYEAYLADEISYAYEVHSEIDETEWFISGLWHLYYCPFCGTFIKGSGFEA